MRTQEEIERAIRCTEASIKLFNGTLFGHIAEKYREVLEWMLGKDNDFETLCMSKFKEYEEKEKELAE